MARKEWALEELTDGVRTGDRRALARAISLVENGDPLAYPVVKELYPETGNAVVVGVTGPPGVGKSSLIAALVGHLRALDRTVGVVSVDPSSPFSRGALLGDRIRLADHFTDPGVYIRSMGTRGHLGGLAETTLQAVLLLDAFGKDIVFVETVGAGQSEVEVTGIADTVLLVLMPGSGDSVQALKAGIMEIPDVIAVNKMDHPAAKTMLNEVRSIIGLAEPDRRPPIVLTDALHGENVPELWEKLEAHRAALERDGGLDERRRRNLAREVFAVASSRAKSHLEGAVADDPELQRLLEAVERRELDPLTAVREIMEKVFKVGEEERSAGVTDRRRSRLHARGSPESLARPRSTRRRRSPGSPVAVSSSRRRTFSARARSRSAGRTTRSRRSLPRNDARASSPRAPVTTARRSRGRHVRRGSPPRSSCRRTRRWPRSRRHAPTTAPSSWPALTSRARWPRRNST